ncbi:MAG: 4Fe-4S dicluster domain-containing protein, partial [Candidatus Hodarchaeota archaeon]
ALFGGALLTRDPIKRFFKLSDTKRQPNNEEETPDDPNRRWGFLIDLAKCNGCVDQPVPEDDPTGEKPRCTYACRKDHQYIKAKPPQYWIRVYKITDDAVEPYFFPKPCQNCENPPCMHVCPTGATFKRKDGTVLIDHNKCVGCRICMAACPYETRFFWYGDPPETIETDRGYTAERPIPFQRGTVIKCDFCVEHAYKGMTPACVPACPTGAIYFGDLHEDAVYNGEEVIPLNQTVKEKGGYLYKEEEGTHPNVYYLPPVFSSQRRHKQKTKMDIKFLDDKNTKKALFVEILVTTMQGDPVRQKDLEIRCNTNFGEKVLANGRTDSNGFYSCRINLLNRKKNEIIVEMPESGQFQRKVVKKDVPR